MYNNVYILGSVHIAVMCVIKHSLKEVTRRYINMYILRSVHTVVMCIIWHSGDGST